MGWQETKVEAISGQRLDHRAHLRRPQRAVDADEERIGVLDRDAEGLDRLAREIAPAPVHRGEREPERQLHPELGEDVVGGAIAALQLRVSKIVSIRNRSTPPSTSARICST